MARACSLWRDVEEAAVVGSCKERSETCRDYNDLRSCQVAVSAIRCYCRLHWCRYGTWFVSDAWTAHVHVCLPEPQPTIAVNALRTIAQKSGPDVCQPPGKRSDDGDHYIEGERHEA